MGSQGAYAGQPHTFFCAKCRVGRGSRRAGGFHGERGRNYRATGRVRKRRKGGMDYHNWGDKAHQYECLDCGHIGWSGHPDVERAFKLSQEEP